MASLKGKGNQPIHGCCWDLHFTCSLVVVLWLKSNHLTAKIYLFAPLPTSTKHRRRRENASPSHEDNVLVNVFTKVQYRIQKLGEKESRQNAFTDMGVLFLRASFLGLFTGNQEATQFVGFPTLRHTHIHVCV